MASYLNAAVVMTSDLVDCVDHNELWRGSLVIREKKVMKVCVHMSLTLFYS